MQTTVVMRQNVVAVLAAESRKYGHNVMKRMSLSLILFQRAGLGSIYVKVDVDGFGCLARHDGGERFCGVLLQ
jgi:hypothetical protein